MVRDAEAHAEEDKQRKEEVEIRNNANSLVHAADRLFKDLEGKISEEDKTKLKEQRDELDKELKENAPIDKIKTLQEQIQETMFAISSAAYQQAGGEGQPTGDGPAPEGNSNEKPSDEDVIDAEFTK